MRRVRRHVGPRKKTQHQHEGRRRQDQSRVAGTFAHFAVSFQSEERRAVQGEQ